MGGVVLDWNDFSVLTFPGHFPKQLGWQPGETLFPAETCARHIYVGVRQAFEDVPEILKSRLKTGLDAYTFVINFASGLRSNKIFDEEVGGQFSKSWDHFSKKNGGLEKSLKSYIDPILHDVKLVKSAILKPHSRRPTEINTANVMANLSPEKEAFVICGTLYSSLQVITGMGNKRRCDPGVMTLTHPIQEELEKIQHSLEDKYYRKPLKVELRYASWNQIPWHDPANPIVRKASAVFVLQPMANGPSEHLDQINQDLFRSWTLRRQHEPSHDAKLIHLKGSPFDRGETVRPWDQLGPEDGFIPYIAVKKKTSERFEFVHAVAQKAYEAVHYLADCRMAGDKVNDIFFDAEAMELTYKLASRPKFNKFSTGCSDLGV
jgi:hypothetical protein